MYRVLHIMTGDYGGIVSVVLNYYNFINDEEFIFDFAFTTKASKDLTEKLKKRGSIIYELPIKSNSFKQYIKKLYEILKSNHYDAVHVHENETSYVALAIAKKAGVKTRIAHSHTSAPTTSIKQEIRRISGCILNFYYATNIIGCGKLAGERIFGKHNMKRKKALVLPNAIDTEKFMFDQDMRDVIRKDLGVENSFVLGMVGRLSKEKNYLFAIDLLKKIKMEIPEVLLVIVGSGYEKEKIEERIKEKKLIDSVKFLGKRNDVEKLYQAFDLFMLPSFHEGFPVVAVEAMASGLPVLLSSNITDELSFGSAIKYLDLNKKEDWISAVKEFKDLPGRKERCAEVRGFGLDINDTAKTLEEIYTGRR